MKSHHRTWSVATPQFAALVVLTMVFGSSLPSVSAADPSLVQITNDGLFKQRPAWSPDGKSLVFARPGNFAPSLGSTHYVEQVFEESVEIGELCSWLGGPERIRDDLAPPAGSSRRRRRRHSRGPRTAASCSRRTRRHGQGERGARRLPRWPRSGGPSRARPSSARSDRESRRFRRVSP